MTVPALLAARAAADPDRLAVQTVGGTSLTFAAWDRRATAVARGLLARGVRPGDRICLVFTGRHWSEYAVAYCGVLRAGAVAVPCAEHLSVRQVREVVTGSGATGTVHAPAAAPPAGLPCGWTAALDALEASGGGPVEVRPEPTDPAQILYTSGTTGTPKGVLACHANLTYGYARRPNQRPLRHSERFLHAFPIGTNAGQTMLMNALDAHPGALVLPHFTPVRFARLVDEHRVGTVFLVPAMAIELVNSPALGTFDLSAVRLVGVTAATLAPATALRLTRAFPHAVLVNYYTSTEAAPAQTSMLFDPRRPAAVGRVTAGQLRITDPAGRSLPAGSVGHVWLRSPHTRSYVDGTGADVFAAGWVRMGDLGRLDEEGYLYLVDRDGDVVKSGAHKVSTIRVEAELYEHPGVAEVAAVGLAHPVLGAVVGVAVVPARDPRPVPLDLADVRGFLRDRLAVHELPARLVVVDRLPRNAAGKVRKAEVAALFAGSGPTAPDGSGSSPESATGRRAEPAD